MKRIVIAAFAAVVGLGMMAQDAEAKRLGGSGSFGMRRDAGAMKAPASPPPKQAQQAAPASPAAAPAAAAAPKSGMSRWLGPLAGLAAGIGLAALLSHFGMGEGVANFLMIALAVMAVIFVVRLIFRKKQPESGMQYAGATAGANAPANFQPARFEPSVVGGGASAATANSGDIPADFDVEGFVRQAKLNFVRMQAANDRGDMDDIREFTSPEVFAEIQMQYQERGKSAQQTDVVVLNAELLDLATEDQRHIASVRFFGQLREDTNSTPEAFSELWHLTKPVDGGRGWRVDGIQQA